MNCATYIMLDLSTGVTSEPDVSQYKDFITQHTIGRPFQVPLVVRNLPASAGDVRDSSLIPESGRSPGGGRGNPLRYSCPWTEEPGGLQSMGSQRVGDDRSDLACTHIL